MGGNAWIPQLRRKIFDSLHLHADLEPAMEYLLGNNISEAAGMF